MTPPLFLVVELGIADTIELTGTEAHHAGTVKRLRVGEPALLADGRGGLAEVRVLSLGRDRVSFTVEQRRQLPPPEPAFTVVQALPKGERAELAVEVLTELGVDRIVPWSASRSITTWRQERAAKGVAKWQRVATEAAKQSRRAWIPQVSDVAGTAQVVQRIEAAGLALVLDSDASRALAEVAEAADRTRLAELLVVVGPEGGISPDELSRFEAAGAVAARLGAPVLRTSTAGAAALAVLSVAAGRWR